MSKSAKSLSPVKRGVSVFVKILKKPSHFWLFSNECATLSTLKRIIRAFFNIFLLFCASCVLGLSSLLLAYGPGYGNALFLDYLLNPYILILNLLPPTLLMIFFYLLFGRSWCAFLANGAITLGLSFANYYLLKFRDDPLMFTDIFYAREAADISKLGYDYTPGKKIIIVIAVYLLTTLFLYIFGGWRPKLFPRIALAILPIVAAVPLKSIYFDSEIYNQKTANYEHIIQWSQTQIYLSKGFIYPFIHSIQDAFSQPPDGYDEADTADLMSSFSDSDIPDDKKVNVFGVMLEAFVDLGNKGVKGINDDAYSCYRALREESYSGKLVTNIFGGGTVVSERSFLTGYSKLNNYRHNVNSYVRYFNSQGYYTDGGHPSQGWFYNRQNINTYLGFQNYRFKENYFLSEYSTDGAMRLDSNFLANDIFSQYENAKSAANLPYFSFNVSYQGHGPYVTDSKLWGTAKIPLFETELGGVSEQSKNIVNNYLGSVRDTGRQLSQLVEKIKSENEPIVLVVFGDHMPWLGDGNSVYKELGINIDVSTYEGFMNYYSTEYIIFANNAAKKTIGNNFVGKGPVTSPCFLMNVLFSQLGWDGPAYMQYTDTVNEHISALNDVGVIDSNESFTPYSLLSDYLAEKIDEYLNVQFYRSTGSVTD